MDWNARIFSREARIVLCGCGILSTLFLLSACGSGHMTTDLIVQNPPSEQFDRLAFTDPVTHGDTPALSGSAFSGMSEVQNGLPIENFYPENSDRDSFRAQLREKIRLGLTAQESKALGCRLKDRFDRSAVLAYNFSDEQSRLALHLDMDGPSLSHPTRLDFEKVELRFTHHFQKPSDSQRKKCLYPSGFQGLVGSAYNEFFVRENYTIWHELRDRGLDF